MRVLLLGPNGQLGHDICRLAEEDAVPIELMPIQRDRLDVSELNKLELELNGIQFDALVNCTVFQKTDEAEHNPGPAFAVNAQAVRVMAEVCAAKKARMVHISTDYIFGGLNGCTPLAEDEPAAPVNVIGASKALGETLARLVCEDVIIVRTASLFGVRGFSSGKGATNFVETIIRLAREKNVLRVVSDQVMSPTGSADVARILLRMFKDGCASGIYHCVNSGAASWFDFAQRIIQRAGIQAKVIPCTSAEYSSRAMRPRYSVLDNSKVAAMYGNLPSWEDALDRYLHAKGHLIADRSSALRP
jgi:dTDP-4-dehydrorhamnose reductase